MIAAMNNVNSNGDKVSNQNQKNGGQSIVPGTAVGELKGESIIIMKGDTIRFAIVNLF